MLDHPLAAGRLTKKELHMKDRVVIEIQDHIADVRWNRPDKHNALDQEQFHAMTEAALSLADRKDVRVVVMSGNGPSFCSGLDYASFMAQGPNALDMVFEPSDAAPANNAQGCAWAWRNLPMPVIAAVHGVAYGGGFQIAMGADIRIAAPDARFSIMEMEYGLIPDMAITRTLRRTVAMDVLKELTFTARVFDGAEAKNLSVVTALAENPLDAAMEMAGHIANRSPDAIRGAKKLFEECWADDVKQGFELEAKLQQAIIGGKNQQEAVMAKMQKRTPKFSD